MKNLKKIILLLVFGLLPAFIYLDSSLEMNEKITTYKDEVSSHIKNIDKMLSFFSGMPAITGAIEFQSFGQIDVIINNFLESEKSVQAFYILDGDGNILHANARDYLATNHFPKTFINNNFERFNYFENKLYIISPVKALNQANSYYVSVRIDYLEGFYQKLSAIGLSYSYLPISINSINSGNILFPKINSFKSKFEYLKYYLSKNIFKLLILTSFFFILINLILRILVSPLKQIIFHLQHLSDENIGTIEMQKYPKIFHPVIQNIIEANKAIKSATDTQIFTEIQRAKTDAVSKIASQAAHDIRSPLEVLKGVRDEIGDLPEDTRRRIQMSINRMEEITFNLLKFHKNSLPTNEKLQPEELLSLVSSVLTEKNIEYKKNENLEIVGNYISSYGLFSKIQRGVLKSILSNLINNSIESLNGRQGKVEVSLLKTNGNHVIRVTDNGIGIEPVIQDKIFTKGFTTKPSGNGLGLHHAKLEIESVGGEINFESSKETGTSFEIRLPISNRPPSFPQHLSIFQYERVIILDDDPAFHEVWKKRFTGFESKLEHFYSISELYRKYELLHPKILLLSDFELMDEKFDGIDVISKFNHSANSILVTARNEEKAINDRCTKTNIKLLPKSLVNHIDILTSPPEVVLIDDDRLVHINWSKFCVNNSIKLSSFKTVDEFLSNSASFDLGTKIFIDSNLGDGIKGEIEAQKIAQIGFKKLYLATAYSKEDISKPSWIIDILGKSPDVILQS